MKKHLLIVVFLAFQFTVFAQQDAWVYFTDKPNATALLSNPINILTQAALDRKANHSVAIDERDVPVHEAYITLIKASTGITYKAKSKWFNAVHVRGTETDLNNLITTHNFVSQVVFADSNLNQRIVSVQDKFKIESSLTDFTYGTSLNQVEMLNVDDLHVANFTGDGVVVAVIDAGFPNVNTMAGFDRLRTAGNLMGGYDFVDRTVNIYNSTSSQHGTQVLSTMAGYEENQYVGTAPDATYYLFRTEDVASENPVEESYWVEAVERADSLGVQVVNTSLGYKTFDNSNYNYTSAQLNGTTAYISKGANIAFEKGLILINSAGNSGTSGVGAPADAAGVLSIAAVDGSGSYANFSSQGSVFQPTQKPDVAARGSGSYVMNSSNQITQSNGTSFSSPILAGGVASLVQALPGATNSEIMAYVRQSASQYSNPDFFLGYGIPDFQSALTLGWRHQLDKQLEFEIFPNPVHSNLFIKFPSSIDNVSVSVYNILGVLVYKNQLESMKPIHIETFSNGLYVLTIYVDNKKTMTFKFIKK
jgi:serine protease AprX